jgi:putative tryptophan/tyrosine transport system substrate-binding protein
MRRREFIGVLVSLPFAANAQQQPARRIGALINRAAGDPEAVERVDAFDRALAELGWTVGGNMRIEYRYATDSAVAFHKAAAELVEFKPDILLASGTQSVAELQSASRSIPIVFTSVSDPLGAGFVDSIAKPRGNITGFMLAEFSFNTKLLELLKEIVPRLTRAAVLRNPENPTGIVQFGTIQAVAPGLGVEVVPINVRDADEIERTISAFARSVNCGLIVTGSASATTHRELIIALAARYKLPAVYNNRYMVVRGGLISYGPDIVDQYRRAAAYVDRILKGEKPGDLPVQAPTKYVLVVNLKAAKALGLDFPTTLLARADQVIE